MGLSKTPVGDEGGSQIKRTAGVDATGMGISSTAISQSSAFCVFHFL